MFIDYNGRVYKTHSKDKCTPQRCVIHNPTVHGMTWWPAIMRDDRQYLVERICPHGVGHPDPDSLVYFSGKGDRSADVHGCDGCCSLAISKFEK